MTLGIIRYDTADLAAGGQKRPFAKAVRAVNGETSCAAAFITSRRKINGFFFKA